MKVKIFYRPVREYEQMESDIQNFLNEEVKSIQDIQFQASNHGLYTFVRYS